MKARIECKEVQFGSWTVGHQYEVNLTWDSNGRFLHTLEKDRFMRFMGDPKNEKGYYEHSYEIGDVIHGREASFQILHLEK